MAGRSWRRASCIAEKAAGCMIVQLFERGYYWVTFGVVLALCCAVALRDVLLAALLECG
jgi:hypothetical protein